MRFSEAFGIEPLEGDDWLDIKLNTDNNFAVDPFLIYQDDSSEWNSAHEHILKFFAMVFEFVRAAQGDRTSEDWRMAEHLLLFPEPAEFCLGVTEGSPFGSGSGPGLQRSMLDSIGVALDHRINNITHIEFLALLQGGIGYDRVSDMVCNILKSYFIKYTQAVCRRHGIKMTRVPVRNAEWSDEYARWVTKKVELPLNPYFADVRLPVLLTPDAFIRDIPVATSEDFWDYVYDNDPQVLRDTFNRDIRRNVPKRMRARLARRHVALVNDYFDALEHRRHDAYPVGLDPRGLLEPRERAAMHARFANTFFATQPEEFPRFVDGLIRTFAQSVEDRNAWSMMWHRNRGREERFVQQLFQLMVVPLCRQHGADVSPESDAGRGPVDFKFSQGWEARAIVELKLVRNTAFWDGLMKQVPQYGRSEEVRAAYFVGIAYTDDELEGTGGSRVTNAAKLASEQSGITITPVIIDARQKSSASKLRMTPEEREQLRDARDRPVSDET